MGDQVNPGRSGHGRPGQADPRGADDRTQLDLFLDSRAVTLVNATIAALAARDAAAAAERLEALRAHAPDDASLPALERLTAALAAWRAPAATSKAIAAAVAWIDAEVVPAARRGLGAAADDFIAAFFRELAEAARDLPYDPTHPPAHRAALALRCGDWTCAEEAALSIPHGDDLPDALHWLALARYRRSGIDAARTALFALAWRAPRRLAATLAELDDELLDREWRAFERACDWDSVAEAELPAWFPAWYLLEHPAAAGELRAANPPATAPARATKLLQQLLDLERRGDQRALAERRARLRELHEEFFALYMARRAVRHR